MKDDSLKGPDGYRFIKIEHNPEDTVNWIFLPGGPGLGSEYLEGYLTTLKLPGTIWRGDFPGDGSNVCSGKPPYDTWNQTLPNALKPFKKVILVVHSFAGMVTLTQPKLENVLTGLVLLSTTPKMIDGLIPGVLDRTAQQDMTETNRTKEIFRNDPTDAHLKDFAMAWFDNITISGQNEAIHQLLSKLPYQGAAYYWAMTVFHPKYHYNWVPQKLPTLILAGTADLITPVSLFDSNKDFDRPNISIQSVPGAGHFPWIENPNGVEAALYQFYQKLST